jgi:hypothetical protein
VELIIRLADNAVLVGRSGGADSIDWMQFYAVVNDREVHLGAESASHVIREKGKALEGVRESVKSGHVGFTFYEIHTSVYFKYMDQEIHIHIIDSYGKLLLDEVLI